MQAIRVSHAATPADILERILDKGIVIDACAMLSLAGLDFISIEAPVVVASIETYVTYAEKTSFTASRTRPAIAGVEET